jgi:hypothetical protein
MDLVVFAIYWEMYVVIYVGKWRAVYRVVLRRKFLYV